MLADKLNEIIESYVIAQKLRGINVNQLKSSVSGTTYSIIFEESENDFEHSLIINFYFSTDKSIVLLEFDFYYTDNQLFEYISNLDKAEKNGDDIYFIPCYKIEEIEQVLMDIDPYLEGL